MTKMTVITAFLNAPKKPKGFSNKKMSSAQPEILIVLSQKSTATIV